MRVQTIELATKLVLDRNALELPIEIELDDMHPLIEMLAVRCDVPGIIRNEIVAPTGCRFLAPLVAIFVAQNDSGPVRKGQPKIDPGPSIIEKKIFPEALRQFWIGSREVAAGIVVVLSVLLPT